MPVIAFILSLFFAGIQLEPTTTVSDSTTTTNDRTPGGDTPEFIIIETDTP